MIKMVEVIVCAALKVWLKNCERVVLPCVRHGFGYMLVRDLGLSGQYDHITEGFMTDQNRFVDRKEAFDIALQSHQLGWSLAQGKLDCDNHPELYSEDLY